MYLVVFATFGLSVAAALLLQHLILALELVPAWLIAVTVTTFCTYGYDKAVAGRNRTRVPEALLLALALAGGTLGALGGMKLFHHKTRKKEFRVRFALVVLLQIALVVAYFVYLAPGRSG